MNEFKLLLVEDNTETVEMYKDVLEDYKRRLGRKIVMKVSQTLQAAKDALDSSIDSAVIDMDLGGGAGDGEEVIKALKQHFRVPVAVYTGISWGAEEEPPIVGVFTKSEHVFEDVLNCLWDVYETGLTRIMGGRGLLEEHLNRVFLRNLLPVIDVWVEYGKQDSAGTKKALLRYTLGHLIGDLAGDETPCYPEEFYLAPPLDDVLTTGSLVRSKKDQMRHVVVTPACDLVLRNGVPKTDRIVLAEIVSEDAVFRSLVGNAKTRKKWKDQLRANNYSNYFHWLPKSKAVEGGFLDFRHIQAVPMKTYNDEFEHLEARIAPSFVKDIVSRFSGFYARQGQPVIEVVPEF